MKAGSDNLLVIRSFQSRVNGKRKMINNEILSSDISTWLKICFTKPS